MLKRLGLVGTAAALALALAGCGEGSGVTTCTADADCTGENEICHESAGVCVRTCTSSADCPTEAKTCKTTTATGSTMICTCATDELCAQELGTGTVCSDAFQVCVSEDSTGGTCSATSTTLGAAGGPDTCNYGDFCSGTTCTAAPVGTCGEATGAPTWNKTAKTAPVITSITAQAMATTNATNQCANGDPAATITINYYAPDGLTSHTAFTDLQNHVKFRTLTSGSFFGANFPVQDPPVSAQFGTLSVGIGCGNAHETAAVYIADEQGDTSNVVCVTW